MPTLTATLTAHTQCLTQLHSLPHAMPHTIHSSTASHDDEAVLRAHTIVVSTARAWDRVSRNWQRSETLGRVKLLVFDRLDLLGVEDNEHRANQVGDDEEGTGR